MKSMQNIHLHFNNLLHNNILNTIHFLGINKQQKKSSRTNIQKKFFKVPTICCLENMFDVGNFFIKKNIFEDCHKNTNVPTICCLENMFDVGNF